MAALFLVVEGPDGGGKSTQIQRLAAFLTAEGVPPVVTLEPGGTAVGARIRQILLDPSLAEMSPKAEALLYAADRAQHVEQVIRPALAAGRVVVSDRYLDSSLAYQGLARGLGVDRIWEINSWATGGLLPDLVLLLDIAPELGRSRTDRTDRIEIQDEGFHAEVVQAYRSLAAAHPGRFAVIDASGTPDVVGQEIRRRVQPLLAPPAPRPAGASKQ